MDVQFRQGLSGTERDAAVQRLEKVIRDKHKDINHIFIESRSLSENRPEQPQSDENAAENQHDSNAEKSANRRKSSSHRTQNVKSE